MDSSNSLMMQSTIRKMLDSSYEDETKLGYKMRAALQEVLGALKPYLRHVVVPARTTESDSEAPFGYVKIVFIDCDDDPELRMIQRKLYITEAGAFATGLICQSCTAGQLHIQHFCEDDMLAQRIKFGSLINGLKRLYEEALRKHVRHVDAMNSANSMLDGILAIAKGTAVAVPKPQ